MMKKFFIVLMAVLLYFSFSDVVYAAPQQLTAEGEYHLGDRDNRETAKAAALADAKRKLVEKVGVYVRSYSETNDLELTKDQITTAANALIKVEDERVEFYYNGTLCKAFILATVDTDNIRNTISNTTLINSNTPVRPSHDLSNSADILRMAGFTEYNGHYYKVFDEGMSWLQARDRCESMNGHLVTITSGAEQAIVQNLLQSQGERNNYWIGLSRSLPNKDEWLKVTEPNRWDWVTGEDYIYSNWERNQPDYTNKVENAVMMWKKSGTWNDIIYTGEASKEYGPKNFGFVCEWENYNDIKY